MQLERYIFLFIEKKTILDDVYPSTKLTLIQRESTITCVYIYKHVHSEWMITRNIHVYIDSIMSHPHAFMSNQSDYTV